MTFESSSEFDYGLHEFVFKQRLEDYPLATPFEVDVSVRIDPCVVTAFTAPSDLEISYTVGDPLKTISYVFDQYPCNYEATYAVSLSEDEDVFSELPDYLQFSETTGVMTVYSKDPADAGTIEINASATLANLELFESGQFAISEADLFYIAEFKLNVTVLSPSDSYQVPSNTAPYLVPRPSQLTAYIGRSFYHYFGEVHDLENDRVTVSIDLGTTSGFAKFNAISNTLTIEEDATTPGINLLHKIVMTLQDESNLSTIYEFTLALEEVYGTEDGQNLGTELVNFHGVVTTPAEIF